MRRPTYHNYPPTSVRQRLHVTNADGMTPMASYVGWKTWRCGGTKFPRTAQPSVKVKKMPARNIYLTDQEYAEVVYLAMKKNMKISDLLHAAVKTFLDMNKNV